MLLGAWETLTNLAGHVLSQNTSPVEKGEERLESALKSATQRKQGRIPTKTQDCQVSSPYPAEPQEPQSQAVWELGRVGPPHEDPQEVTTIHCQSATMFCAPISCSAFQQLSPQSMSSHIPHQHPWIHVIPPPTLTESTGHPEHRVTWSRVPLSRTLVPTSLLLPSSRQRTSQRPP